MDDKEKEVKVEEITEGETKEKEEKKENAFSKFWNKTKKSINDSILESNIEKAYEKGMDEFKLYEKNSLMAQSFKGELNDGKVVVFGEKEYKLFSVVIDKKDVAYYLTKLEPTTVKSTVEKEEYERPGTILYLDKNVEEVNVIKAGKRYFIYKGSEEEK